MAKTVAFLGLGTMGSAMSNNLIKAGFTVRGYDPMTAARERAETNGVRTFASSAEAVQGAEAVCSAVPTPDDVIALYTGEQGALLGMAEGTVCFDFSTITPEVSCRVAEEAKERGVTFLDTPVSGSAPRAIAADLAIMAGGDPAALEQHRDVLDAMTRSITHFGENGAGLRMKLVANHLVSGQLCLLAEALTLGQKAGLDAEAMADYLYQGGVFEVMKTKGREMARRDYTPQFKTDLMAKDLRQVAALAESVGAPIPFSALAKQIFTGAQALGHGQDDQNAVLEVFTRLGVG